MYTKNIPQKKVGFDSPLPTTGISSDEIDSESDEFSRIRTRSMNGEITERTESTESSSISRSVSSDFISLDFLDDDDESGTTIHQKGWVQKILAHRYDDDGNLFLFVKINGKSYKDCEWIIKEQVTITRAGQMQFSRYWKKYEKNPPKEPYYDPSYEIPEKVISSRQDPNGRIEYLVKWTNLDYDMVTWEPAEKINNNELIQSYQKLNQLPPLEKRVIPPRPNPLSFKPIKVPPTSKHGYEARSYQLEGLNFIVKSWYEKRNVILADEMGLGKTVQASIFLKYLSDNHKRHGPFLIVAPLSTIPHWEREIEEWTNFKTLTFCGSSSKRKALKQYELFYEGTNIPKFNVLITTYEYIMKECHLLSSIQWRVLVVDETQRLKNHESKLITSMRQFNCEFILLLTGTPLQNSIDELWTLLNFLDSNKFNDLSDFQAKFGDLNETEQVIELQTLIKPFMIRRKKSDVEKSLTPLEEIIIECPMTQHQKAYYKSIYNKNIEYLVRGAHSRNMTNLQNISMELRKVCNHPYLINGAEDQILIERCEMNHINKDDMDSEFINNSLIRSAGKMILLDKLLVKLKNDGHRVLIFSQMTRMLDILHDYLTYKGYEFERIDGHVKGEQRQEAIDKFNEPNSKDFIFLLCTKAGGVGINLTSADTVIIYDSDWNPQNDIQATARCHRIGQTKEVKMYRFITAKSYERKMFDRASIKLGLDHAVLESDLKVSKSEEIERILRLGAYFAFEEDDNSTEKFGEEDIDTLISNSTKIRHDNLISDGSKFSITQFEIDESENNVDLTDPDFWQKYLPQVPQEDDISSYGLSISERHKLSRENALNEDISNIKEVEYSSKWSKKKINELQKLFLRFGWGRWHIIHENCKYDYSLSDLKHAMLVFLSWYIDASEEHNEFLESLYRQSITDEYIQFEKKFNKKHKKEYFKLISPGASWKLNRLTMLFFLHSYATSLKNPPDDIILPQVFIQKPCENWTDQDDKALIYGTWKYGFQQYDKIEFPCGVKEFQTTLLTNRLRSLVSGLFSIADKNQKKRNIKPQGIGKRMHHMIIRYLTLYGYPDPKLFAEQLKTDIPVEQISLYVDTLLKYCDDMVNNKTPEIGILIEAPQAISTAQRILRRVDFFKRIREYYHQHINVLNSKDLFLLKYIDEHGTIGMDSCPEITSEFGNDKLESKIFERLAEITQIFANKRHKNGVERLTLHDYELKNFLSNEDGSPQLPLKIGQTLTILSLGEYVNKPKFQTNRYIYTNGFVSEHIYHSVENPKEKEWYRSSIIDEGGEFPLFKVEFKKNPEIYFTGQTPSTPWISVVKAVEEKKKELGMPATRSLTISGPEFYGLSSPICLHLLQNLRKKFLNLGDGTDVLFDESGNETLADFEQENNANEQIQSNNGMSMRTRNKLQLKFDFTKIIEEKGDVNVVDLYIDGDTLLDRDSLGIAVPYDDKPLEQAIKRMIPNIL
ncbi:F/Y-rich N-terminus family protein [Histomonas meleagridis]|uniref:F/Y-rich N-terminus family protein n=1 Tax=Histomonas meleagridis TaxID=135588 RepID=UPI00355A21DA|nr:F/Y-rich N-terminus family protein [Histomonas meleagridis]KAH0802350.1 F/Y-rich N-terminus family protein [Histomonas meleagridis]